MIRKEQPISDDGRPEVVGFGALNVDYIASASRLTERMAEKISESTARFEWNREGPVDEQTIMEAMRRLGAASLACSLGGSAWLTVFALAHMGLGVRLGYVGVVGRVEAPGLSFVDQMDDLSVDRRWVGRRMDLPCGLCLSYLDDTDRVMLTHPGANFEAAYYLRENFTDIAAYVASARYVHVTSFLDAETPVEVLRVLLAAKERNPQLKVSFDPGFDWAEHQTEAIAGILSLTDLLFVNYREFKALGRYAYAESDDAIAKRVLERCSADCAIFVTKKYDFVEVFRSLPTGVVSHSVQQPAVPDVELEDATGAGDVFAAGVLASLVSDRLTVELGARLGLTLARHKLLDQSRLDQLDLSQGFLQRVETIRVPSVNQRGLFIVHDEDPQWRVVQRFLEADCHLVTVESGTADVDGTNIAGIMGELLAKCSFAVCVLSAQETIPGGRRRVGQNIVHQVGIFQGRYGFGRVALLAEEGCDTFSNIAGLIRLDFPAGRVDSVLLELERMLLREGLMRPRDGGYGSTT